jgi:hypothetical protein
MGSRRPGFPAPGKFPEQLVYVRAKDDIDDAGLLFAPPKGGLLLSGAEEELRLPLVERSGAVQTRAPWRGDRQAAARELHIAYDLMQGNNAADPPTDVYADEWIEKKNADRYSVREHSIRFRGGRPDPSQVERRAHLHRQVKAGGRIQRPYSTVRSTSQPEGSHPDRTSLWSASTWSRHELCRGVNASSAPQPRTLRCSQRSRSGMRQRAFDARKVTGEPFDSLP